MDLKIERGKVVSLDSLPSYSIALDGFCSGPQIDAENHKYSFDHHANCLRFCTSSCTLQAWTAIMLGLDPEPYTIYINDSDADVCTAIYCLKNPERCREPLLIKLVNAVNLADCHGGGIELNGMAKVLEWISAPETDSKRNGDYSKLSDDGLKSILEAVLHRIDLYLNGEAQVELIKQPKHGEFNVIRNQNEWALIESNDPHAFAAVYQAGFERIVLMRKQDDDSIAYTLAKKSDFIDRFPIPKFYNALNAIEPGWGGGSTIGGAPRNHDGSRSKLSPDTVVEIIDGILSGKSKKSSLKKTAKKH